MCDQMLIDAENEFNTSLFDLPLDCLDQIFLRLNYDQLGTISRTCNYLYVRVDDFKKRYIDEFNLKLEEINRSHFGSEPFNFEHDEQEDDIEVNDGNFLVDYDDDPTEFMDESDEFWAEELDDDFLGHGSNYGSDEDEDL